MTHHYIDGEETRFGILRRIESVWIVTGTHPPQRELILNCGHRVRVPRQLRPTVGKLTACHQCEAPRELPGAKHNV